MAKPDALGRHPLGRAGFATRANWRNEPRLHDSVVTGSGSLQTWTLGLSVCLSVCMYVGGKTIFIQAHPTKSVER